LAQIGEFSFVLAGMGVNLELLSGDTYNLILAAALISIALNPVLFAMIDRWTEPAADEKITAPTAAPTG